MGIPKPARFVHRLFIRDANQRLGDLTARTAIELSDLQHDLREAPSLSLITALKDMGARVRAFDPIGVMQARAVLNDVNYSADPYDCAENADAIVIATEWEQFRALDLAVAPPVVMVVEEA